MSDSKANPSNVNNKNVRRNLPLWMSLRENESKSHGKKLDDADEHEENDGNKTPKQAKDCDKPFSGSTPSKKTESNKKSSPSSFGATNFSKLLALEMGAEYQHDWNSNCTLLVRAFLNNPKFRQVEANCGTIISKEWISECYSQKKLVDIESYLMHAGKPQRRQNISHESSQDPESSVSRKAPMQIDGGSYAKSASSATKPEGSEIKKIAAEGILSCLQDAIDSLKQKQDIQ